MIGYNSQRILYLAGAVACCIALLGSQVASAEKSPVSTYVNVIDSNDIEFIAEIVCETEKGNEYQIAEISTINKLFEFFEKLPETHKLFECHDKVMSKLRALKKVIDQKADSDICGSESIDSLLKFHQNYIFKSSSDLPVTLNHVLPRLLKFFFIHYAYEVSLTCKDNLIKKLDSPEAIELDLRLSKDSPESLKELDRLNDKFSIDFGGQSSNLSKLYDIMLVWPVLDRSPSGPDKGVFSEPTYYNNYQRCTIVSPKAEKILRVQKECAGLKPLYESPLLAVVRLIDIGYYLDDEPFAAHLSNRASLRRLIGSVIVCETLAPVGVLKDDSLKVDHILLSNKEAKDYPKGGEVEVATPEFNFNIKPRKFQLASGTLSYVTPATANEVLKKLKVNLKDREKYSKRVFRAYLGKWKLRIRSSFTKLFSGDKKEKKDLFPTDILPLFEMLI